MCRYMPIRFPRLIGCTSIELSALAYRQIRFADTPSRSAISRGSCMPRAMHSRISVKRTDLGLRCCGIFGQRGTLFDARPERIPAGRIAFGKSGNGCKYGIDDNVPACHTPYTCDGQDDPEPDGRDGYGISHTSPLAAMSAPGTDGSMSFCFHGASLGNTRRGEST